MKIIIHVFCDINIVVVSIGFPFGGVAYELMNSLYPF